MPSKLLPSGVVSKAQNSPLGPGIAIMNLTEITPAGVLFALNGNTGYGLNVGLLAAAPTFNLGQETTNILDNVVGGMPALQGAIQLESQEVSIEVEFVQINRTNLEMALPGLQTADWNSAVHASLNAGAGNSAIQVVALASGVGGNSINLVISAPSGGTTSVSVATNTITVAPKTAETAAGVVAAINAHATANDLVQAGLPSTSNGSGAIAALTSTPLAGGAAGSVIGESFSHKGFWASSDYSRNFCAVFESANTRVAHVLEIRNVISMDDFEFEAEDEQVLAGVGMTLTATATEADYNSSTGTYAPPFRWHKLADVAV